MGYRIINGAAYPVGNFQAAPIDNNTNKKINTKDNSFKEILDKAIDDRSGYKVSKHAAERLNESNFTEKDMKEIAKGFDLAKSKNSKNSLMLYKNVALVASIENKTVITAVDKDRAKENIFTNIDSVVML